MSIDYDVIIIGTGPGGGTLAYRLAPSGKKILLLEWGDYLPREKDNWSSKTVFIDNKYKAKETWKDKDGGRFTPASTTQRRWDFEGLRRGPYARTPNPRVTQRLAEVRLPDLPPAGRRDAERGTKRTKRLHPLQYVRRFSLSRQ